MKAYLDIQENFKIEAKKAKDKLPLSVWETYSAFANSDGGTILLGVSEDKDGKLFVTGVINSAKMLSDLWSSLNNNKQISANILKRKDVEVLKSGDLEYIKINVPRAENEIRPIYLNDNIKYSYKRDHSGDYKCTLAEINAMIRDQVVDFDLKALSEFDIGDLDMDSVHRYRNMFNQLKPNNPFNNLPDIGFLERIKALKVIDDIPRPTIAGLMFFGYDYKITNLYPSYFLDYQEKLTDDLNIRYTDRIHSDSGDWSGNIFDFYFRVVGKLTRDIELPFKLKEDNIHRISETSIHVAVREALANCLVNADFNFSRGLVIKKTYTELTFENPGSLRISLEQAHKGGISDPRNSTILQMFNHINVGERAGSGIPKIWQAFKDNNLKEPVLYEKINPNRTFLNLSFEKIVKVDIKTQLHIDARINAHLISGQELKIINYLREYKEITRKEVETILNVGPSRANIILKALMDKNIIKKVGESTATKYIPL